MANNTNPDHEKFDFAEFFAEFGKGATNRVASQRMQEIVKACSETGRKGKIVITLEVGAVGGVAELRAKISVTKPEPQLPGGVYFATEDGGLVEEDPRQLKLPVARVIDLQPVKNINKEQGQ
ncbi:MAG TPA: hypothetical protein VMZ53_03575 [Kofleriaceae bacterium]|nr:hypothetical protein [Kofleriaceae bacterium]